MLEDTISLQEIFGVLKKRMVLILLSAILFLGLAAVYTYIIVTPKYSSSAQLIVKLPANDGSSVNVNDVNANLLMINTYKDVILEGSIVRDEALSRLVETDQFKGTTEDIKNMISVNQAPNSQMFTIKATSSDAYQAVSIANMVATVFQEKAKEIIDVDKVTIIAPATLNTRPVSPNNKLNLAIGFVLGIMVGLGLAFILELLDKTIKDERFIVDTLQLTILGVIPEMSGVDLNARMVKRPGISENEEQEIRTRTRTRV